MALKWDKEKLFAICIHTHTHIHRIQSVQMEKIKHKWRMQTSTKIENEKEKENVLFKLKSTEKKLHIQRTAKKKATKKMRFITMFE